MVTYSDGDRLDTVVMVAVARPFIPEACLPASPLYRSLDDGLITALK